MSVHVDEMVSEVTAESDAPAAEVREPVNWEEQVRVGEALARMTRDRARTAAEGYDD
jgi:hypothetical protein